MVLRRYHILIFAALTMSCSPDEQVPEGTGITSEDAQMLDKAAARLDGETDPDQPVAFEKEQ